MICSIFLLSYFVLLSIFQHIILLLLHRRYISLPNLIIRLIILLTILPLLMVIIIISYGTVIRIGEFFLLSFFFVLFLDGLFYYVFLFCCGHGNYNTGSVVKEKHSAYGEHKTWSSFVDSSFNYFCGGFLIVFVEEPVYCK